MERNQSERGDKAEGRQEATQVQVGIGANGERKDSTRSRIVGRNLQPRKPDASISKGKEERRSARGRWKDRRGITGTPESALAEHPSQARGRDISSKPSAAGRNTKAKRRGKEDRNPDSARQVNPTSDTAGTE